MIDAGLLDAVDGTTEVATGVVIEPAHGHTEGHCIATVTSGAATAVFSGDVFHHPQQIAVPDWNSRLCRIGDAARQTRRLVLDRIADRDIHLFPAHFRAPSFGTVQRGSSGLLFRKGVVQEGGAMRTAIDPQTDTAIDRLLD